MHLSVSTYSVSDTKHNIFLNIVMALDKFLAKNMLVLYYSLLRGEFVGLYVRTVVGYNGPCTWDSVVHTGRKKKRILFKCRSKPQNIW